MSFFDAGNDAATQTILVLVKHHRLAWSDCTLRGTEFDPYVRICVGRYGAALRRLAITRFGGAGQGQSRWFTCDPG